MMLQLISRIHFFRNSESRDGFIPPMLPPFNIRQWDRVRAAHLLNRAGFGGAPEDIDALHALGFERGVDSLVKGVDDSEQFPKPEWAQPLNRFALRMEARELSQEERKLKFDEIQKQDREHQMALIAWWLGRMRFTLNPAREKLTLFWHGHFATSAEKVKNPYMMWLQNETLRRLGMGSFADLTKAVARDPAMMVFLDTDRSRKLRPNENFARELMELFTLGIGNYSEEDIKEAARAFTGFKFNDADQTFRFAELQQDDGEKVFMGKRGKFVGDDIVDIIMAQPQCARFIVSKLWTFYAYENPESALVENLAADYRKSGYNTAALLRAIFQSSAFYGERAIRSQIKSPVQFVIALSRGLDVGLPPAPALSGIMRQLGQIPFLPPSVKGWDGGKAWITTASLLNRYNLANFALGNGTMEIERRGKKRAANGPREIKIRKGPDLQEIAPTELRAKPQELIASLYWRLFNAPLDPKHAAPFEKFLSGKKMPLDDASLRELMHLMASTPQFQLT